MPQSPSPCVSSNWASSFGLPNTSRSPFSPRISTRFKTGSMACACSKSLVGKTTSGSGGPKRVSRPSQKMYGRPIALFNSVGALRGTNTRPTPSVRAGPEPLPPVPTASASPSVRCCVGSWQVAQETSRFPLRILSNISAWPRATIAGSWWGASPIGTIFHWVNWRRSCASSDSGTPGMGAGSSHAITPRTARMHSVLTCLVIVSPPPRRSAQRQ